MSDIPRATRAFIYQLTRLRECSTVAVGDGTCLTMLRDSPDWAQFDALLSEALKLARPPFLSPRCRSMGCQNAAMPNKPLCWQHGGDSVPDLHPLADAFEANEGPMGVQTEGDPTPGDP